jgi:preprotein translocase subunit SecA
VVTDLKKAYESEGKQLIADFEKTSILSIVDGESTYVKWMS